MDDLVLMPERQARRLLNGRASAFFVLAPVGRYAGRGLLRVLRARPSGEDGGGIELVCGYESYQRIEEDGIQA